MSDTKQSSDNAAKVIIYSTTWCAFCKTEKQYLERLGVGFVEMDIEADKEAYDELMQKNGGAFPAVQIREL